MSVEPQALERSVLERKQRDELQTIAEALGMKPTSGARKAELVDQILREAGIENGEEPAKPKRARTRAKASDDGDAPADATAAAGDGDPPASETDETDESGSAADVAPATASATSTEAPADAPATTPDGSPGGDRQQHRGGQQGQQSQQGQQGQQGRQGGDGAEPGNRRNRRRRGRDRDRGGGGDRDFMRQEQSADIQYQGEPIPVEGLLDLRDEGYGFLHAGGYLPSPKDVYVSLSQVRRFALRKGDYIQGASRPAASNE
ncbi:MAG: hypothetical protein E6G17_11650, partial [Actinobacteria bacterium]